jgi:small basic protein
MLQGLLRLGFSLNRTKSVIWLLIIAISILLSFIFLSFIPQKLTSYLFLIALNISFALMVAVILIYLGSDLGLRWIIGTIGFLFYFVGDPLYLLNNPIYPFFWCLPYFSINITVNMEG